MKKDIRFHYALFLLLFSCNCYFSFSQEQVSVSALIYDQTTRKPIEFANVGFVYKNLGTLSDDDGYFNLTYPNNAIKVEDTLRVSVIGYYDFSIPASKLEGLLNKQQIILINPRADKNESEEIDVVSWKDTLLGYHIPHATLSASMTKLTTLGGELATLVPVSLKKTRLEKLYFYINENTADSIRLGVNIYEIEDGQIGKNLLKNSIEHLVTNKTGQESIDLNDENLIVANDIVISLELLKTFGDTISFKLATAKEPGFSFTRYASQSNWEEHPVTAMAYGLEVTSPLNNSQDNSKDSISKYPEKSKNSLFVTGIVTSSGRPVQGSTVRIKGTLTETTTNSMGKYSIDAVNGDVLLYEFLTTKPKSVLVRDFKLIDVSLEPKYTELDEAFITADKIKGYGDKEIVTPTGKRKSRTIGYAAYSKDRDELPKSANGLGTLLVGQFPGLIVNPNTGEYQMRGNSSISLSNGPLFVVDNIPYTSAPGFLDINTIVNVTVVPGLAGNTIYGTTARNGVIIITTKMALNGLTAKKEIVSALVSGNDYTEKTIVFDQTIRVQESLSQLYAAASFETAKKVYNELKQKNKYDVSFYEATFRYFEKWDENFAHSILVNIAKIGKQNPKALLTLAYLYDETKQYEKALRIYKQIVSLEPHRAQSHLDLARVLVNVEDYRGAFSLYKLILSGRIIGATFNEEVLKIVGTEVRHLVTKHKSKIPYEQLPLSFYEKAIHLDARIVFDYNDPEAFFEVQFVNSGNKYSTWSHTQIGNEERLLRELEYGYNTKEFTIEDPDKGQWIINIQQLGGKPSYLKYTVYKNYGRPDELKEVKVINLNRLKEKTTLTMIEF